MLRFYTYIIIGNAILIPLLLSDFILLFFVLLPVFMGGIVWAVFHMNCQFFIRSIIHFRKSKTSSVALTFDDGPHPENTPQILDTLAKMDAKATFFVIGEKVKKHPEILERIQKEGHTFGNHSYSHANLFPVKTPVEIERELNKTNQLIEKITGKKVQFFRPPFGVTNPRVAKGIDSSGMTAVGWSVRTFDTVAKNVQSIIDKATRSTKGGDIILLHDTENSTVEALPEILNQLRNRGIAFENIETLYTKQ